MNTSTRNAARQQPFYKMPRFMVIVMMAIAVAAFVLKPRPTAQARASSASTTATSKPTNAIFARSNLAAWCIVPYDGRQRTPAQRAEMLDRIGIHKFAYDWRAKHLPGLDTELDELQKHHIELTGLWFPDTLNEDARFMLACLEKHHVQTQLWVTSWAGYDGPQDKRVKTGVDRIQLIAEAAKKIGCKVGLYNHGGWFGEPENQIAMVEALKQAGIDNVGIVYNLHHGYGDLDRFPELFQKMLPHLLAVNLNGMTKLPPGTEQVVPVGQGTLEVGLIRTIRDSGYSGPVGLINESDEDAGARLLDNIEGLDWVVSQLDGETPTARPQPRTWRDPNAVKRGATETAVDHWSIEVPKEREKLPLYKTIAPASPGDLTPANAWPSASEYDNWYRSHGSNASTRFSPLTQINRDNVKDLQIAWTYHSDDGKGNIQCNPVIVDGVVYAPTVGNCVVAIDGETGKELWRFKPQGRPAHRGLTYYKGTNQTPSRLLFAAGTSLWSLDPATGKPIETFGTRGHIEIQQCVVPPAVYQNVIVYAGWNSDVFGVELSTGKPLWTFHTIPQSGEPYADTWDKGETGANVWGGMSLDASRGIAYVTTGSPKPNFIGVGHLGDNLFANCVLAIDVTTGTRLWHFQEIRHDIWDLDGSAAPILVSVASNGAKVDAVAAVTKAGNTLLLDRVTGKPLFPFRMRRSAASTVRGERTALYQPDVELPQPFARRAFTLDDVTNISDKAHDFILDKIGDATLGWYAPFEEGKPMAMYGFHGGAEWTGAAFDPATGLLFVSSNELPWLPAIYRSERPAVDETKIPATAGRLVYQASCMPCHGPSREGLGMAPSLLGVSNRLKEDQILALLKTGRGAMPPAELDDAKKKDLLNYILDRDRKDAKPTERPARPSYRDAGYPKLLDAEGYPGCKPPWGLLNAIDLNTGKIVWRVPLGEYPELTKRGIPKTGTENFGGAIVTAGGLVFCAGTRDIKIRAFDKTTGAELWSSPLPFGGFAPPATYHVKGKQYVIIPATGGGKLNTPMGDAYVAFRLP